jgi:hypothetical protein
MMGGGDMAEMMKPENMMGPMRTGMELFRRHAENQTYCDRFTERCSRRHRIG